MNDLHIYPEIKINNIKAFLQKNAISYNNIFLYLTAFTHGSFFMGKEMGTTYQRLEFLGDSVLATIVSKYLFKDEAMSEGDMTKMRAKIVCKKALASFSSKIKLQEIIIVHQNMPISEINDKILADTFESFLGALFLDQGFHKVEQYIIHQFLPVTLNIIQEIDLEDYKTKLQEIFQAKSPKLLSYRVLHKKNNPQENQIIFIVGVFYDGKKIASGEANSKKKAEQKAAYNAINKLSIKS